MDAVETENANEVWYRTHRHTLEANKWYLVDACAIAAGPFETHDAMRKACVDLGHSEQAFFVRADPKHARPVVSAFRRWVQRMRLVLGAGTTHGDLLDVLADDMYSHCD